MAAGAGSGKTRALTGRLKWLISQGIQPERIVAITFTNKAADTMRERVFGVHAQKPAWNLKLGTPGGGPFIGTFHSFGARILKAEAHLAGRTSSYTIFDDDDSQSLIKKIAKEMDLDKERFKAPVILKRISNLKSELLDATDLLASGDNYEETIGHIYERYEATLKKNNAFDFDDLITTPVLLLTKHPEILKKYRSLFSHILVDEYQDINTAQYQLIRKLGQEHGNVTVVGDDAQAIYSFRGADFKNFLNFERDWPQATVIPLEQNYRSSKTIIAGANAVIANNRLQRIKNLWTDNEEGKAIKVVAAEDADTESDWVCHEINGILDRDRKAEIAVIYRTNAQSRAIEQSLINENLRYKIFGGLKFYARKEIKDVVAGIRLAANPNDSVSKERLEKSIGKRLGASAVSALSGQAGTRSLLELIALFMQSANYAEYLASHFPNPQERLENISELINFAGQFTDVQEFLERVALLQSSDAPSGGTRDERGMVVSLMSIHLAKGLEFDYVFVIGCNEGVLPHERSLGTSHEVEEERRLMYVAMTRARKELYLLFHVFPSRFLHEIPGELVEFVSTSGILKNLPNEDDMYIE